MSWQFSIGGLGVRKRTFGKVKSIACIHGRSPVILIQLARFDSVASNTAIGGFKAHRFTLLDHFRVLSFAIRPQSARCSFTTVTLPSSGLTVSAVQETKFPPHLLYSSPEGAVGEGQWQLFVIPPCKSICVSMYWDLRILKSLCL